MRALPSVTPTPEQLKLIGDVRQGFRIIRGAAGSGKTTTSLLRLREQISVRLKPQRRRGNAPVRVLVLTFNRTLQGYIAELARHETPDNDALELEVSTFGRWARSLVGEVNITGGDKVAAMLRPHLDTFATSRQQEFLVDEVQYILGRFPDVEWVILEFGPEILGDRGVVFSTTNNIYPAARRGRSLPGFEQLFAPTVAGRYGHPVNRGDRPSNQPTDPQAEVLYPFELALEHLHTVTVPDDDTEDAVDAALCHFGHAPRIKKNPEAFR